MSRFKKYDGGFFQMSPVDDGKIRYMNTEPVLRNGLDGRRYTFVSNHKGKDGNITKNFTTVDTFGRGEKATVTIQRRGTSGSDFLQVSGKHSREIVQKLKKQGGNKLGKGFGNNLHEILDHASGKRSGSSRKAKFGSSGG